MRHISPRSWTDFKASSSWLMFKIMSEFVDGFERMDKMNPCVCVFGSARTKPGTPYYEKTVSLSQSLAKEGFGIITGGGPGIMEAANKGAWMEKATSVGLNIELPHEQGANPYIDKDKIFNFKYFYVRKVMFLKYSQAVVLMPGGFGNMDEMFETLTLVQTGKIERIPIILFGSEYWKGLLDWMKSTMCDQEHNINPADLEMMHVTDDPSEVIKIINDHYMETSLKPTF